MSTIPTPDRSLSESFSERPPSVELTRPRVQAEKNRYVERSEKRGKWSWKKIAALAIGAYTLYHFRYWMREKLHLAFSKVPQSEIEGNMTTTAVAGRSNLPLYGNAEPQGTNSGESVVGPVR